MGRERTFFEKSSPNGAPAAVYRCGEIASWFFGRAANDDERRYQPAIFAGICAAGATNLRLYPRGTASPRRRGRVSGNRSRPLVEVRPVSAREQFPGLALCKSPFSKFGSFIAVRVGSGGCSATRFWTGSPKPPKPCRARWPICARREGCLEKLRAADRDVVCLYYTGGATVQSVAADIGRPLDTVKSVLKRSRRALYQCVQKALARRIHR